MLRPMANAYVNYRSPWLKANLLLEPSKKSIMACVKVTIGHITFRIGSKIIASNADIFLTLLTLPPDLDKFL